MSLTTQSPKRPAIVATASRASNFKPKTESGTVEIEVPRDCDGSFEPQLIQKRQRRVNGLNEKMIALYSRGLSTRDIQAELEELYGVEISPTVKSRENGSASNKSIYLALGINLEGEKELLGMWISESERASFWQQVFAELQSRGVDDCYVACVDGLKGLPEAIEAIYPRTQV